MFPKTRQQAAVNIKATMAMASLLVGVKLIDQIESAHLAILESRCIMAGMRREMYDDAQVQSRTENRRISPLRTSSPIGGSALALPRAVGERPEQDASQALKNLSLSISTKKSGL